MVMKHRKKLKDTSEEKEETEEEKEDSPTITPMNYQYNQLVLLSEISQNLKGIGIALNNIGELLEQDMEQEEEVE